jgi:hypothetical protein
LDVKYLKDKTKVARQLGFLIFSRISNRKKIMILQS